MRLRRRARRDPRREGAARPAGARSLRVTGYDVPYPYWQIEDAYMPSRRAGRRRGAQAARLLVALHELPLDAAVLHGYFSRELEPVLTRRRRRLGAVLGPERGLGRRPRRAVRVARPGARHRPRARRPDRGARRPRRAGARRADRRGRARAVGRRRSTRAADTGSTGSSPTASAAARAGRCGSRRSSACSGCRRTSRASTRRSRRGAAAATSTARSSSPGTTLFLPIPVDGARFSAGDGHAAQGDGEVSGTAIEAPVEATLTLDVRDDLELEWPVARIDGAWLTFGFDEHLGRAARIAVDGMLDLMEREHGLSRGRGARARVGRRRPARDAGRQPGARRARGAARRRAPVSERLRLWLERGAARLPAPRRGHRRARPLGGSAHPGRRGGGRQLPPRGAPGSVVRPGAAAGARPRAGERARPERGRDLERGADAPGRLRARGGRARARAATSRRSRSGASRAGSGC